MNPVSTLDLIVALSDRAARTKAVEALAPRLGAEAVLLFVRDPVLGALLPAPGLAQTLRGGRTWRSFLTTLGTSGRYEGEVELPGGTFRPALALVYEDTAVVLLGGTPRESEIAGMQRVLPLLSAMLGAEQRTVLARAEASAAKVTASRAEARARIAIWLTLCSPDGAVQK